MISIVVGVLLAATSASCSAVSASWRDVKRVHLVDMNNASGNFMFRGASPNVAAGTQFDINKLRSAMVQAASDVGVTMPSQFRIIDVNLLNMDEGSYDEGEVISEFTYFRQNPQDGSFLFWQTLGTGSNATDPSIPAPLLQVLANTFPAWDNDDLENRALALKALLDTQTAVPSAIYFHCDEGCDRTGETYGAYAMRIHGKTWNQVNSENLNYCGRPQMCHWYKMMQFYCLYLNRANPTAFKGCLQNIVCTPTQ